ncbi:MAG: hypothetical protein CL526_05460 [Aequorivita sp.]|nr:hypothetical protein [Aequorivita sp.]|tara:strand:- start:496 stop:675 length:180 start_codon:yes stop_codon:yes gene_type:complete
MKSKFYIALFITFSVLLSSCATTTAIKTEDVAGYNLKSKKENMQNKILPKKNKTIFATP